MVTAVSAPHPRKKPEPSLNLPLDKVSFIILKAREYDVKEEGADPDSGSNPIDDGQIDILTNKSDDPVREELLSAVRGFLIDLELLGFDQLTLVHAFDEFHQRGHEITLQMLSARQDHRSQTDVVVIGHRDGEA